MTRANTKLRDLVFACAKRGFVFDCAYSSDTMDRNEGCIIPSGPTVRVPRIKPQGASPGPASSRPTSRPLPRHDMTCEVANRVLEFLADRIDKDDLESVRAIMADDAGGPGGASVAQDSLRRRVAQGVTRQRKATGTSYDTLFPNARRLG